MTSSASSTLSPSRAAGEAQQLGAVAGLGLVGDQRVGRLDPELRLRRARRRPAPQPRQLLAHQLLAAVLARGGLAVALGAREHVGRVAALVLVHGRRRRPPRSRVQTASRNQRSWVTTSSVAAPGGEVVGQPVDALDVEVVGRLVEQQQLGVVEQRAWPARSGAARRRDSGAIIVSRPWGKRVHRRRRRAGRRGPSGSARRPAHSWSARPPTSSSRIVWASSSSSPWPRSAEVEVARAHDRAGVGLLGAGDQAQQRRLAVAVAARRRRCGRPRRRRA